MAQSDRLASSRQRLRSALLLVGLVCALPWLAEAEEDLSRDEAKQRLNETEQQLQSNRAKEHGIAQDLAALAEERARLNGELIEAGKRVQASEAKLSETESKLAELTDQVNVIRNSITERKETIVKMLSAMQRIGRTPPPALVTRRDDALAVVRSAMLLADVFPGKMPHGSGVGIITFGGGPILPGYPARCSPASLDPTSRSVATTRSRNISPTPDLPAS